MKVHAPWLLCSSWLQRNSEINNTNSSMFPANNDPWFHMFYKWIHEFPYVNSLDSVNKFGVLTRVYHEIMSFSRDDTYQWNRTSSHPVQLVSNSFKIRDNRQNTCIHVNTHENRYCWSGTNYEPVWHVSTGSEMVPCLLGGLFVTGQLLKSRPILYQPNGRLCRQYFSE